MGEFHIHSENERYHKRVSTSITGAFAIVAFIFIGGAVINKGAIDWPTYLGLTVFIFTIVYFQAIKSQRFYILSVSINADKVELSYTNREQICSISDAADCFKFEKTTGFGKTRVVYLSVFYNQKSLFKQPRTGYWTESRFDEIIEAFDERNISKDSILTTKELVLPKYGLHMEDAGQIINMGGPYVGSLYFEDELLSLNCVADNLLIDEQNRRVYFVKYHARTEWGDPLYFTVNYYCINEDRIFESVRGFDTLYIKPSYSTAVIKVFHGFHDQSPVKNSKFNLLKENFFEVID
ncbi:hypothetical protein BEL04_21620 [Mucilaginibacter sp. PPCGB 2223]|uniref:hypothetical protein n=1 Tax=Mucilaginibacter sp. PPCGB 2223 TaxID=1886027 RepID=UPI000826EFF4|nr:hypothetical protein [Mucilaginibacter sp. PPCGB 2223]OCX50386.1 hypothetical protein BEL04_21620 [Mucilaginibacter sp. PPCGB 2223]